MQPAYSGNKPEGARVLHSCKDWEIINNYVDSHKPALSWNSNACNPLVFIRFAFTSTTWKSAQSTSRQAKQMSLHMQHKGLIHAWEILLPILKMPLIQNVTQLLMVVFIGSPLKFQQKRKKEKKLSDENSDQGVWEGKPQRHKDRPFIFDFCLSQREF